MYPGSYARTTPEKPAIIMGSGERITYRQLDERSNRLAHLLRAHKLSVGDHVSLLAENHSRYYEVYWAALRSGLYFTGINRHSTPDEAAYVINDSGTRILIVTHRMASLARETIPLLGHHVDKFMIDAVIDDFESYEVAVADFPDTAADVEPRGEVMLYSSGTTGRPKGIRRPLSGRSVDDPSTMGTSRLEARLFGMDERTIYLMPAPLYHAGGLQWSAGVMELGGTVVVMEKFDPEEALRLIERHRITHAQFVPTMLVRMLKLPETVRGRYDVSSLQCLIHAAAPCPVDVKRQIIDWFGPVVFEHYSGTEGNGLTAITTEEWLAKPGSVGQAKVGVIHICDDDGVELAVGGVGTVYFEREAVPFTYHNDFAKADSAIHPTQRNWTAIGDIGYLDDDSYLFLTDRKAFTIISGGVNIYPAEIEGCLVMHPDVLDVAVFGLPDHEMGEYVHAVVQPAPGAIPSRESHQQCRA